jgi:hypothetical protein
LKDRANALLILLTLGLSVKFSFYCPVTELLQGLALLPVWYSILHRSFRLQTVLSVFLLFLLISAHPLMFIPVGVALVYWSLKRPAKKAMIINWGVFLIFTVLKMLFLDTYDHQKTFYPVVFHDYSAFRNLKDIPYILQFLKLLLLQLPVVSTIFFAALFLLISQKATAKILVLLLSVLAFLLLILVTHRFTEITNYSERMLLPLCALVAFPFCEALFNIKTDLIKRSVLLFSLLLIYLRLPVVYAAAQPYTLRNLQMEELIHQSRKLHLQKVIAEEPILEQVPYACTGWCYSIESTLLSALDGPDSVVSIAMLQDHINRIRQLGVTLQPTDWIKWTEAIIPYQQLSPVYFHFLPANYVPLRTSGPFSRDFRISFKKGLIPISKTTYLVTIQIEDFSSKRICVGDSLLQLNFTATSDSGNQDTVRSVLHFESDFIGKTALVIPFDCGHHTGGWVFKVSVYEGVNQQTIGGVARENVIIPY